MKILALCNYFQPMNYGENEITRELTELGHTVTIVTGDRYFPFPKYNDTVGKILGPRMQKVGASRINGIRIFRQKQFGEFAARSFYGGIKEKIEELKPDIILVFGVSTPTAIQAALFKPKRARLILIDSHLPSELNSGNHLEKTMMYSVFRAFFAPLISARADKIIAVQEATVDVIANTYGVKKPAVVISHGTNKEMFRLSMKERKQVRRKLDIPEVAFVIIYTGKIIESKGVKILFEAYQKLLKKHSDIHLLIVGSGPQSYIDSCLETLAVSQRDNVHLTGLQPQDSLPSFYSAADVAVWPLQESLAMNDAASCSLPLIVSNQVGVKERLSNNNALLYKQGNVVDLAKKIETLYLDSDLRKAMGKRGRQLVEEKMSWRQKALAYIE